MAETQDDPNGCMAAVAGVFGCSAIFVLLLFILAIPVLLVKFWVWLWRAL